MQPGAHVSLALFRVLIEWMQTFVPDPADQMLMDELLRLRPDSRGRVSLDDLSWQDQDRVRDFVESWLYEERIAGFGGTGMARAAARWLKR